MQARRVARRRKQGPFKNPTKWTKDRCREEALKFAHRGDFYKFSRSCYSQVCRNGWLNDLCGHMEPRASLAIRWIYVVKSRQEQLAYVGLTQDPERRRQDHQRSRFDDIRLLMSSPHDFEIVSGPHPAKDAARIECETAARLRDGGWTLLNRAPLGSLGYRRRYWTKDRCVKESAKYTTVKDFRIGSPVAYAMSSSRGWLEDVSVGLHKRRHNYWTLEKCAQVASLCETRVEFRRRFGVARQIAQRNGWTAQICAHMKVVKRPNGYWTQERCACTALSFKGRGAFALGCPAAYDAAWKNGWLADLPFQTQGKGGVK